MVTKRSFGKQSAFVSSIMYTLLVVAFCFVCTSARAMALYTYAFFTQTYTPWPGPPLTETIVGPNAELNFLSLTLSEDVGVLSFNWAPTCDNDVCLREDVGIESATFSGYIYDPHSFAAGMFFGNYDLMTAGSIIEVGRYQDGLFGSYRTVINDRGIIMSRTETGWTGTRGCCGSPDKFTGNWRLVDVAQAPEPATLALLGIGLAGICVAGRRKAPPPTPTAAFDLAQNGSSESG